MSYKPAYEHIPPATYGFLTKFYDFGCEVLGLGKSFKRKILDSVEITDGSIILDVGCGTGVFLEVLGARYRQAKITGIDPDTRALEIAKRRLEQKNSHASLCLGYAEALPFREASFDYVFSTLAFHHIPEEKKKSAVFEVYRVLKPGGRFVLSDFGRTNNFLIRLILSYEEFVAGNLSGAITEYMREAGFKDEKILLTKFPALQTLIASK
ncbi:MAG: class I SAM-dependent methyltransferase [Candidatus Doudnabacteria bacterium]|nr:class I SAM-dependent methyltransferase [Candidatus Doudnabacteria bacterium]